ncbi:MAG: DUF6265 family protein [Pseudomonadota bacterium]
MRVSVSTPSTFFCRLCGVWVAAFLALFSFSQASSADAPTALPTWLIGCWISDDQTSLEAWTQDTDDALIGFSSLVRDGQVVFYELMSLRRNQKGELVFTAYPSNQPPGAFTAVSQSEDAVVFLNTEHDYPQRIRYRRQGDQLLADIARADGEKLTVFDKTRCTE